MPIYEYICKKCDEMFAVYQSINDGEKNTKCPECGSNKVKKIISAFSACSIGGGDSSSGSAGGFGGGFSGG